MVLPNGSTDREVYEMRIYFETENGFKEIGKAENIELSAEEIDGDEVKRYFNSEPIEMTVRIENIDRFERMLLGQSAYNAMKLRKDGYLSPENGWVK